MNSLYITRYKNGRLCICADIARKNGTNSTLFLSWNTIHINALAPDFEKVYALKVGERIDIV